MAIYMGVYFGLLLIVWDIVIIFWFGFLGKFYWGTLGFMGEFCLENFVRVCVSLCVKESGV